ncbi:chemotaxis protein MotB [Desulfosarcina ovata subsp. sediminis]|uniref:Chemotaxis protein MotB n=1 Tax=Desulfosarcina ovata subsp. sediminis TaxID=885957 RepID=A0A5K7ZTZ8_9BACT|nr:OmpA family protein [Desulfosarcina ovata]BBO83670.1 chemotaxis protein MotB [Desulfosarcina ovata subsp. sediminis]
MATIDGSKKTWRLHRSSGRSTVARFTVTHPQDVAENDTFLWTLTDIMTLLLIFFVLLYSNAVQQSPIPPASVETANAETQIEAIDKDVSGASGLMPEQTKVVAVVQEEIVPAATENPPDSDAPQSQMSVGKVSAAANGKLLADLENSFSEDFYVRWEDRQPVIVLGERITFNQGEATLLADAQDALKRVAGSIARIDGCQVMVTGHTDDRPIRTHAFPSNWELSAARAASVAKALMASGVAPERMMIQGKAAFKPLVANTSEQNRRTNRRVEIALLTKS